MRERNPYASHSTTWFKISFGFQIKHNFDPSLNFPDSSLCLNDFSKIRTRDLSVKTFMKRQPALQEAYYFSKSQQVANELCFA